MSLVKLIHIGDTHQAPGARQSDRASALRQIYLHAAKLVHVGDEVGCFLWPGDLFHTESTPEDRNFILYWVMRFANVAPVVIVRGNHDRPGDLDYLAHLDAKYPVYVVTEPELVTLTTPLGQRVEVYGLPYPEKAGFVASGVQKSAVAAMSSEALDVICLQAAEALLQKARGGEITVFALHANVAGAIASTGQPQIGTDVELSPASLEHFHEDVYIAGSHIHRHQPIGRGAYAGSISRMDFGENDPKGFVEVTYEFRGMHWNMSWAFVPLDVPNQILITGSLDPAGFVCDACSTDDLTPSQTSGADIRVIYTYKKAESDQISEDKIKGLFPDARSVKCVGKPIVTAELRAPKVSAATTLLEKTRAWVEMDGGTWSESLEAKASTLLQESVL